MSERKDRNPEGPFVRWLDYGYDGWLHESFPTLRAALEAENYGHNFVMTKLVDYTVTEIEPASTPSGSMSSISVPGQERPQGE